MQRCFLHVGDNQQLWCPKLANYKDGVPVAASSAGWVNILSKDWESIVEKNEDPEKAETQYPERPRILFAKSRDVLGRNRYRFIGVFEYSPNESDKLNNVYRRISKTVNIRKYFEKTKA